MKFQSRKDTLLKCLFVAFSVLVSVLPLVAQENQQLSQAQSEAQPQTGEMQIADAGINPWNLDQGFLFGPALMGRWKKMSSVREPSPEVEWLIQHGNEIILEADRYYSQIPAAQIINGQYSDLVVLRMRGAFENVLRNLQLELSDQVTVEELRATLDQYRTERDSIEKEVSHERKVLIHKSEQFLSAESQKNETLSRSREEVIAKVMYRLADLYYLDAEEVAEDAYLRYDMQVAQLPPDAALPPEPVADYSKSIGLYRQLIDEYPTSSYVPDALYNIGVILADMDNDKATRQAQSTFETLVDNFPQSRYIPEVLYRIGDYFFMKRSDPRQAIPYFSKVLDFPESEQYIDALYMLGWCNFFIGENENYSEAVDYFDKTIKYTTRKQEQVGQSFGDLIEEAVRYTALIFADEGEWEGAGVEQAVAFLKEDDERKRIYGYDFLLEIGKIEDQDFRNDELAINAYESAIDLFPLEPRNPWTNNEIINLYWNNLQDEKGAYEQRQKLFDRYRHGTDWDNANRNEELRAAADTLINMYYYQNFLISANAVLETKTPESVSEALKVTQNYLTEFPETEKTPYVQYTMAALLEDSYSYDPQIQYLVDAYEAYTDVVVRWGENEYREKAGQRMFDIARTLVKLETEGMTIPPPTFRLGKTTADQELENEEPAGQENKEPAGELLPPGEGEEEGIQDLQQEMIEGVDEETGEAAGEEAPPAEENEDVLQPLQEMLEEGVDTTATMEPDTLLEEVPADTVGEPDFEELLIPVEEDTTEIPELEQLLPEETPEDTTSNDQGYHDPFRNGIPDLTPDDWDALANAWVQAGTPDVPLDDSLKTSEIDTAASDQSVDQLLENFLLEDVPEDSANAPAEGFIEQTADTLKAVADSLSTVADTLQQVEQSGEMVPDSLVQTGIDELDQSQSPIDTSGVPGEAPTTEAMTITQPPPPPVEEVPPVSRYIPVPLQKAKIRQDDYPQLLEHWRNREEQAKAEIQVLEKDIEELKVLIVAIDEMEPPPLTKEEAMAQMTDLPLLTSEKMLLFSISTFTDQFPDHKLTPDMLYKGGTMLFDKGIYPQSRVYFQKIIDDYKDSRFYENAWLAILDGYFSSEDYVMTEKISRMIKAEGIGGKAEERAGLLQAASIFKAADKKKAEGDKRAAAMEYRRAALDVPDFEQADKSLYNSAIEFMELKEWNEAITSYELLIHGYPKSEFVETSYFNIGVIFRDNLNDPLRAAGAFDTLAFQHRGSKYDRTALSQASANYEAAEDWLNTIRVNQEYVRRFPKENDTNQYLFETAGLYLKLDDTANAMRIYDDFARRFPDDIRTVQASYEQGEYYLNKNDQQKAKRYFEQTVAAHKHLLKTQNKGYPEYASKAMSKLTEWKFQEFAAITYTLPKSNIERQRERKVALRKELIKDYRELIEMARAESFQAFYRMAQLDESIAFAEANQEMILEDDIVKKIQQIRNHNEEAISFYIGAQNQFKDVISELAKARVVLSETKANLQNQYDSLNVILNDSQKKLLEPDLPDSLKDSLEQSVLSSQGAIANLSETQKQVEESTQLLLAYQDSCRFRIPEIALINGDLQFNRFKALLFTPDEGARRSEKLFYRDQVLRNFVIPDIAPTVESYILAVHAADTSVVATSLADTARSRIVQVADTLFARYVESINFADKSGYSFYTDKYERLLAQEDEDARAYGLYVDEMPDEILNFQDLILAFSTNMQDAANAFMESFIADEGGIVYQEEMLRRHIRNTLSFIDRFEELRDIALEQSEKHRIKLEKTLFALEQDAMLYYGDFATNWKDYSLEVLGMAWEIPDNFQVKPNPETKQLIVKLVTYDPAVYGYLLGLKETTNYVVSDSSWVMALEEYEGFETLGFDDQAFQPVQISEFPEELQVMTIEGVNPLPIGAYTLIPETVLVDTLIPDPNYFSPTAVDTLLPVDQQMMETPADTTESELSPDSLYQEPTEGEEVIPDTTEAGGELEAPSETAPDTSGTGEAADTLTTDQPMGEELSDFLEEPEPDTTQVKSEIPDTTIQNELLEFLEPDTTVQEELPEETPEVTPEETPPDTTETAPPDTTEEDNGFEELLEPLEDQPGDTLPDTTQSNDSGALMNREDLYLAGVLRLTDDRWDALENAYALQPGVGDTLDISEDVPQYTEDDTTAADTTVIDTTDTMGSAGEIPEGYIKTQVEKTVFSREGEEVIYFRKTFTIENRVSYAELEITADDDWVLYINGELVDEDTRIEGDWKEVTPVEVTSFLKKGENVIAVVVEDMNRTGSGLWVRLNYNTVPEIPEDLNTLKMISDTPSEEVPQTEQPVTGEDLLEPAVPDTTQGE